MPKSTYKSKDGFNDRQYHEMKDEIEYAPDGFHTNVAGRDAIKPYKKSAIERAKRRAIRKKDWSDDERRWIYLALFEANNNVDKAVKVMEKYQKEYGEKEIPALPSRQQIITLTRGRNFENYLRGLAEGPILGRLIRIVKAKNDSLAERTGEYLINRPLGKPTIRVEEKIVSVTLSEQTQAARDYLRSIKPRDITTEGIISDLES